MSKWKVDVLKRGRLTTASMCEYNLSFGMWLYVSSNPVHALVGGRSDNGR